MRAQAPAPGPAAGEAPARIVALEHGPLPAPAPTDGAGSAGETQRPTAVVTAKPGKSLPLLRRTRRHPPLPYPICPTVALSYCMGQLRVPAATAPATLPREQVTMPRRCERDVVDRAIAVPDPDIVGLPDDLGVIKDHCAPGFLKTRTVTAARLRLELAASPVPAPLADQQPASKISR